MRLSSAYEEKMHGRSVVILISASVALMGGAGCRGAGLMPDAGTPDSGAGEPATCRPDVSHLDEHFAPQPRTQPEIDPDELPRREGVSHTTLVQFPESMATFSSYWTEDGQNASMDIHLVRGTYPPGEETVTLSFFVNGAHYPILDAALEEQPVLSATTVDGRAEVHAEVPSAAFDDGLNTVHIVEYWRPEDRSFPPRARVSKAFTVFHDAEAPLREFEETPVPNVALERLLFDYEAYVWIEDPSRRTARLPRESGAPFNVAFQTSSLVDECDGVDDVMALVLLREGVPIPWDARTPSIIANLSSTQVRRDYALALPDAEVASDEYYYVVALYGLGRPLEDRSGTPTQWFSTSRPIARSE